MSDIYDYFEEGFAAILCIPEEWKAEVYSLHNFIKALEIPGYKIEQIKEKFGGLRFYCSFDLEACGESNDLRYRHQTAEGAIAYVEWKLK